MVDYSFIEVKNMHKLAFRKRKDREEFDRLSHILSLIDSDALLSAEFKSKQDTLFSYTKKIEDVLNKIKEFGQAYQESLGKKKANLIDTVGYNRKLKEIGQILGIKVKPFNTLKLFKPLSEQELQKYTRAIVNSLESLNSQIIQLEEWFKEKYQFSLVDSGHIYFCLRCGRFIGESLKETRCLCGKTIKNIKDTLRTEISYLKTKIMDFFTNGCWLEYGIDKLLKKLGGKNYCGVYVLGKSRIDHEIDNLTVLDNNQIIIAGECRDKDINLKEVIVFNVKNEEIGSHIKCFFTTSKIIDSNTIKFAKNNNILLFDDIFKRSPDSILEKIKSEIKKIEEFNI